MNKPAIILWIIICISLSILSFTQIDVNLTFINFPPALFLQEKLFHLGYFYRNINGIIFSIIFAFMSIFYIWITVQSYRGKISSALFKKLTIVTAVILFLSYNVFSHDFFNYIFDARILTKYHLSPYLFRALDFPGDDWIRFMHWTHRTYPYGPVWLLITVVPSLLGLQKFILTYFLFKSLFVGSYLLGILYLKKILSLQNSLNQNEKMAILSLFAFSPLILIDGLVSPHIDFIMGTFILISIYFILSKKYLKGITLIFFSAGIKYVTAIFLPILNPWVLGKLGQKDWRVTIFLFAIGITLMQFLYTGGLQNWYLLTPLILLPILAGVIKLKWLVLISLLLQIHLINYLQFIFSGKF